MKMFVQVISLVVSLSAMAQVESGTLIVINASQDEIVAAADSRSYSAVAQFDDRCKITTLGNQLIFAASGTTGYGPTNGRPLFWDAHTLARQIFLRLVAQKQSTQPLPRRLAVTWAREAENKLKADLKRDKEGTLFGVEENTLTSAVVAGFYRNSPMIVTVAITYSISTKGRVETSFAITNLFTKPRAVMLGREEIANELFMGQTPRSQRWRRQIALEMAPSDDPIAFPTISAVQYSIDHYPLVKIGGRMLPPLGGPIDVVRLRRPQGIEWIQRKQNCPDK